MTGDDELVEKMAEAMRNAAIESMSLRYAVAVPWGAASGSVRMSWRAAARAALAVAEPVIRERAAVVAERRWRDWPGIHPDDANKGEVCDDVTACADIARAIRTGATP